MAVNKINEETLEKMKKKSILSKPSNLSARGVTSEQVKASLTSSMFDKNNSLTSEINRVVDEINENCFQKDEASEMFQNTTAYAQLDEKIENGDNALTSRLDDLIQKNLLEHNYYISTITVSDLSNNVWYADDDRIVDVRDGLSLTIVVPVTTNKELTVSLNINNLQQGYIIYDIQNPSKQFILKEGAVVQLIGLFINSTYYFVVISDSKNASSSIHFGSTEGEQLEGSLWYDTNNN